MKRFLPIILILAVVVLALSNCSRDKKPPPPEEESPPVTESATPTPPSPSPVVTKTPEVEETPEESTEPPPYDGPVNPLSGMPSDGDMSGKRPIAIMINNKRVAQPQLGVSKADIMYEVPVEGGITRMMAVFQDITGAGVIGSVRSSRTYYLDLAQGHDAIYIHAGGSPQAYRALSSRNITSLDGVNGSRQDIFYRDAARRKSMGYEHSLVTSDELILKYLPKYNFRLEHKDGYECQMKFADDGTPEGGLSATTFDVYFASSKKTAFSYDAENAVYNMNQQGGPYKDGNTGELLAITNVLVLRTQIGVISGDTEGRLNVKLTGSGEGYFFCGGKYVEITWSKQSETSQFVYKLKDGTPLVFGRGRSYICIIPTGTSLDIIS